MFYTWKNILTKILETFQISTLHELQTNISQFKEKLFFSWFFPILSIKRIKLKKPEECEKLEKITDGVIHYKDCKCFLTIYKKNELSRC